MLISNSPILFIFSYIISVCSIWATPIPFKPSSSSSPYPFETSFTFSITTRIKPAPGHGLAFVVVPVIDNRGAGPAGFRGILNNTNNGNPNNHIFAVEFDVFHDKTFWRH